MDTMEFLKRTALFSALSDKELQSVQTTAKQRSFDADKVMVRDGQHAATAFYLILDGEAEVRKEDRVLARLGPGDYFGEMALLLENTPRTADVVAVGPTTCLLLTQWDFRTLVAEHPEIGTKIMTELARRLRDTDRALSE